jgi:hypothetical protein
MEEIIKKPKEERTRKPRSDKGPRLTDRDLDALEWIAQQYAVSVDHLATLLARLMDYSAYAQKPNDAGELTEKRTAKIIKRWEQLQLIERGWILHGDPAWVWLTPEGLRATSQELGELRHYIPTPAKINHIYWCNHARLYIEQRHRNITWIGERELRATHKSEPGEKRPHTPDAVVTLSNGRKVALEVELSSKTYNRLDKILEELAESEDYNTIWYFCLGRAKQVIEHAIENMSGSYAHRFLVYDVEELELE